MATIKSYTDIPQSKVLAEILPLESADMLYWAGEYITHPYMEGQHKDEQIPIWSLAALLEAMPNGCLIKNINGKYKVLSNSSCVINDVFNNPVDACVAMIEKLYELKML